MTVSKSPEDEKREQQRMQDVLVLLQHLVDNEETTIKLIIECLFDVGAVNFINREIQNPAINQVTKNIASLSKPIAKRYGLYWFKKNFPELIANWLQRKIAFPPPPSPASLPETGVENQADIVKVEDIAEVQVQGDGLTAMGTVSPSLEESDHALIEVDPSPRTADNKSPLEDVLDSAIETSEPTVSLPPRAVDYSSLDLATTVPNRVDPTLASPETGAGVDAEKLQSPRELQLSSERTLRERFGADRQMELEARQIQRLRGQVKVLVSLLVGTTLMSGVVIWHLHLTPRSALDLQRSIPSSIIPPEQSGN